jgi:polyhydroxyalkanoate synthase
MMLWHSSRAALTSLNSALPRLNGAAAPLQALAGEIARRGVDAVGAALDGEVQRRAAAMLAGLEAYRRHSYRRRPSRRPVVWREGTTRLLDYGGSAGPVVLVIPSLINRYHVLDLLPQRSFLACLAGAGLRPLVVDWGVPGRHEAQFGLDDYIGGRLDRAVTVARGIGEAPVAVLGYCMGGLLALASALRRPGDVAALALLATPWDFHAERRAQAELLGAAAEWLSRLGDGETLPVAAIQSLFFALDPFLAERKFRRFAGLDPESEEARVFVALEDWINDGVPLASRVAQECAWAWYRDNLPGRGLWRVAGLRVTPRDFAGRALVVLPSRDRIVPPLSAAPLARALPRVTAVQTPLGHIGMMSGHDAPQRLWPTIAEWLRPHGGR